MLNITPAFHWYRHDCDPQGVDALLDVLAHQPLDPTFEAYGNFIMPAHGATCECDDDGVTVCVDSGPLYPQSPDAVRFWGNFANLSAVFCVDTDEPETIAVLTQAIRANQATPAYLAAKREQQAEKPRGKTIAAGSEKKR